MKCHLFSLCSLEIFDDTFTRKKGMFFSVKSNQCKHLIHMNFKLSDAVNYQDLE